MKAPDPTSLTIARTPVANCPACQAQEPHWPNQRREFHPLAGHGLTVEGKWSHPDLEPKK
jgi:hypothetical protein